MEPWLVGTEQKPKEWPLEPEQVSEYPLTGVACSNPWPPSACCCPGPSPVDSPGGVHGNVRLSWLLFVSTNLKNALVFPFGLGSPQQLPFMSIELGTEAVGARGQ